MQTFTLRRIANAQLSTRGELYAPDGVTLLCEMLERGPENVDHPRIKADLYYIDVKPWGASKFDNSLRAYPIFDYRGILWLPDVPGRTNIEIHPANNALLELEGCLAPGMSWGTGPDGQFYVNASRPAYAKIYPMILAAIDGGGAGLKIVDEAGA